MITRMGCPLTPPLAFRSATYISNVFFSGSPRKDAGPVTDSTAPILISACAGPNPSVAAAAASSPAKKRLEIPATDLPPIFAARGRALRLPCLISHIRSASAGSVKGPLPLVGFRPWGEHGRDAHPERAAHRLSRHHLESAGASQRVQRRYAS